MIERFVVIRPDPDPKADPGWRHRIDSEVQGLTRIIEERVLPERVNRVDAHRIIATRDGLTLTPADVAWLYGVLGELLDEMRKADEDAFIAQYAKTRSS